MKLLSDYPKTPLVTLAAPIACFGISSTRAQTTTDPLTGTWDWTLLSGKYAENLEYRADGILPSTSGGAVTQCNTPSPTHQTHKAFTNRSR